MSRETDPRYQQMIDAGYSPEQIVSCAQVVALSPEGWHLCRCQVVNCEAGEPMARDCGCASA